MRFLISLNTKFYSVDKGKVLPIGRVIGADMWFSSLPAFHMRLIYIILKSVKIQQFIENINVLYALRRVRVTSIKCVN
jgi:hypothetical protein